MKPRDAKTALVFAGTSFLGRFVRAALQARGVRVVATSRRPVPDSDTLVGDLADPEFASSALEATRPDWIVNCAGAAATSDPVDQLLLHVSATRQLLAAVHRIVPRSAVVLIGSAAEYGEIEAERLPIREDCPPAPSGSYGSSKLEQTRLADAAARERNLRILVLRPFNILGPGLPEHYFAAALARRLASARRAERPGEFPVRNLQATRDFVDVRDVAEAVAGLLETQAATPGAMRLFNVATGRETSLLSVATHLGGLAGGFVPIDGGSGESRSPISRSRGDASRLRQTIGWNPRFDWERSIQDLWMGLAPDGGPA